MYRSGVAARDAQKAEVMALTKPSNTSYKGSMLSTSFRFAASTCSDNANFVNIYSVAY